MGVQSLWTLLEPCGRRVNIEALTNKRLAVDASIWIFQFMQTMRDSRGEMLKNAHILGFFRRICRLLFHRIRPIFVFDGATPPLKRRTTIARRRRREQQTAKLRKTAEKLLMAQLKKRALQMNDAQNDNDEDASAADEPSVEERSAATTQALQTVKEEGGEEDMQDPAETSKDAMLAQQLAAELEGGAYAQEMLGHLQSGNAAGVEELTRRAASAVAASSTSQAPEASVKEEDDDDEDEEEDGDEEVMVPEGIDVDPVVMSTLPHSMQLDLMQKIRDNKIFENRSHFQRHAAQPLNFSSFQIQEYLKASAFRRQIDGLKDTMNASAVAGVEGAIARRIAADEGREYILQREELEKPESPKASKPAMEQKPHSNGSALEISLELPSDRKFDVKSILLGSPQQQKQSSSEEEEWLDVDTGQPPSVSKAKHRAQSEDAEHELDSGSKKPKDWRERKAQRQKYWSVSQGFRFGRKLAEWGEDAPARPRSAHVASHDGEEDADVQEAIRQSLMSSQGKQAASHAEDSDDEGDLVWQGITSSDAAQPSSSIAAANGNSAAHAISLAASKSNQTHPTPAKAAGIETSASKAAGTCVPVAIDSSRAGQEADEQRSQRREKSRSKATGSTQRPKKKLELPSLAEQPAWQPPGMASPHLVHGATAGQASSAELAQKSVAGNASERPATAERRAQGTPVQQKGMQRVDVKEKPQGPVAAALREQLDAAEAGALTDSDAQELPEPDSPGVKANDTSDIQEVLEKGRGGPVGHPHKQPADAQPLTVSHADASELHRLAPETGLDDAGSSARAARQQQQADTKPHVQQSAVSTPGEAACRNPTAQRSGGDSATIAAQKLAQHPNGTGSIAFTGLVQDRTESMPGIPAGPAARAHAALPSQQAQVSTRAGRSDSDLAAELAAEAEEEMRSDMARQEQQQQQEPPDEDRASADPWAEDPWGQGNLWEDPGQGQPWVGPPPITSAQAAISAVARQKEPEHPPVAAAFNMDEELLMLEQQTKKLKASHRKQVGTTESPTTDMYGDCQELLQLFGLPYIIAPAEAEAQCAWLDAQGLVDGVVTDDNDAFLFGAKHIYRHIFEGRKYVEEYHTSDIERELGMDRLGLICLALLLGSDYTEGVAGIGIVNAVEVVRVFKEENGMQRFRNWVMNPDEEELREAAQPKPKRGRKRDAGNDIPDAAGAEEDVAEEEKAMRAFKRNHRKMRRNWDLPSKFPDIRVIDAYRKPALDESKERFTYGRPDAQLIRNFCLEKFGWNFEKVDQILDPVLKAYDARQAQATMDSFLAFNERFAKIRSKRLQQAVRGISKTHNPDMMEDCGADTPKKPARKRSKKTDAVTLGSSEPASQLGVFAERSDSDEEGLVQLASESPRSEKHANHQQSAGTRAGKGKGRGRGRGRGRGKSHAHIKRTTASQESSDAHKRMNSKTIEPVATKATKVADEDVDWEDA